MGAQNGVLGASWDVLEASWAVLEASWSVLKSVSGQRSGRARAVLRNVGPRRRAGSALMPMSCLARSPQVCGARDAGAPRARELGCRRARRSPARWSRIPAGASASSENETASSVDGEDRRLRAVPGSFAVGETVKSGEGTTLVIRNVLGKGSFGTTYACERPDVGDEVALKVLTLREMRDWKALQLFEREAKTLKGLSHPAIPAYVDYFEVDSECDRGERACIYV